MTHTFYGDACTFKGSESIPYGKIGLNVVVEGQSGSSYGFVIATLEEGKTPKELQDWPSTDPPEWLKTTFYDSNPIYKTGSTTVEIDLTPKTNFGDDPIYFICFATDPVRKIGAGGPLEIVK